MQYKHVVCSVQCSMCSMKGPLQLQVQCVMYNVQCAGCSVLFAKDEDLAVETG